MIRTNSSLPCMCRHVCVCSRATASLKRQVISLFPFASPEISPQELQRSHNLFLQKGARVPSGACQGFAAPPDLAGAVPVAHRGHSTPHTSPSPPPRCAGAAHDWRPDVTWWQGISGGERTPRGPFYAGWRTELNDLREEPVAL